MEVITQILHYIQEHVHQEMPLEMLAAQAHYSPYHFHRLFKQQVGEAPKQYILRLRLEKATKELLFYPDKTVYAIAIDCGFSSQSVFARAFKSRYGITAEQYRVQARQAMRERTAAITPDVQQFPVTVVRMEPFPIACEMTLLENEAHIMEAFRKLYHWAAARDLCGRKPEYYGIFLDSPHTTALEKCRYLCAIRILHTVDDANCQTLGGMRYARIPVMGNMEVVTDYALYVKKRWLESNGYDMIQGIPGFEHFPDMDFDKPYALHHRIIYIGIQPR